MAYRVLIINGSPKANGCTARALREVSDTLRAEGVETDLVHVGKDDIRGCVSCGFCYKNGRCVFNDKVNETAALWSAAPSITVRRTVRSCRFSTGCFTALRFQST